MNFYNILSYLHTDPLMQRVWNPGHKNTWRIPLYFHNVRLYSDCHTDIHLYLWIERKCKKLTGVQPPFSMNIIPDLFISMGF